MNERPVVFIASSEKDACWRERLISQLQIHVHQGTLEIWDERRVMPGDELRQRIREAMDAASVLVLLITADFLCSWLFQEEILVRLAERRHGEPPLVFPLLVRPCDWTSIRALAGLACYPSDNRFISSGTPPQIDADLARVASSVRERVAPAARGALGGRPPLQGARPLEIPKEHTSTRTDDPWRPRHTSELEDGSACVAIVSETERGSEHDPLPSCYLLQQTASIGRLADNLIVLTGAGVSRSHARIDADGGDWFLRDRNSTCGTYLNYRRVVAAERLQDGDMIVVGPTLMKFFCGALAGERMYAAVWDRSIDGASQVFTRRGLWLAVCAKHRGAPSVNAVLLEVLNLEEIVAHHGSFAVHLVVAEIASAMRSWFGPEVDLCRCGVGRFLAVSSGGDAGDLLRRCERVQPTQLISRGGGVGIGVKLAWCPVNIPSQGDSDVFWAHVDGTTLGG
ncbi:hypothetical protein BE11_35445 [Sorangium cellulosum]|nr:hypothetical protein BE11_35445 [Sorangium cellulosum]